MTTRCVNMKNPHIKSNETSYLPTKLMVHNVPFWYLHGMLETICGSVSVGADCCYNSYDNNLHGASATELRCGSHKWY